MRQITSLFVILLTLSFSLNAWAGGAHQTNLQGIPYRWQQPLVYNVDQGDLKPGVPAYSHDNVAKMVRDAFATWQSALTTGGVSVSEGLPLPLAADGVGNDVNAGNYSLYINSNKDVNPVVFDSDGQILEAMLGRCSQFSVFALTGFEKLDSAQATVLKGRTIFSGACIPDAGGKTFSESGCGPCSLNLDETEVRAVILHELGHLLGMDHSQLNPQTYLDCVAQGSCSVKEEEDLPTMFPLIVPGAAMQTLSRDDTAYFNRLYGDPTQDSCSVSGRVLADDGRTELRGVEVVARNLDANLETTDAMAFVSGAEAPRRTAADKTRDNCTGNCGKYTITGLSPGQSYRLCVQNILPQFQGAAGINPVNPPDQLVAPNCSQSLTLTCQCSASGCASFTGQDIVTQPFDGNNDVLGNISQGPTASAGGCSLVPEPQSHFWARLKNLLVVLSVEVPKCLSC